MKRLISLLIALFLMAASYGQIIYVKSDATGTGDGNSWANAFTSLQTALSAATSSSEIWVAAGIYKPTTGTDRTISFQMKNNVAIYGGFAGTESSLSERNMDVNKTILSGDIGTASVKTDNSYHVVYNYNSNINSTAILDGFTITGGNAIYNDQYNWYGGGLFNGYGSSPTIKNCTITGNSAMYGGGISNYSSSSPVLINCLITGNSSSYGGGMYNYASSQPILTNCTIAVNSASLGGGFYNSSSPTLRNSIIWGNTSTSGGNQIYNSSSGTILNYSCYSNGTNDIVNSSSTFSPDANCITTNPKFVNPSNDFRIVNTSPCADTGNDAYNAETTDIRGTGFGRKLLKTNASVTGTIDMGAYEFKKGTDPGNPTDGGVITGQEVVCFGFSHSGITSTALPTGHVGTLEYKWQMSTVSSESGFTDISSSNSENYSPGVLAISTWFKRLARINIMTDWDGAAESNVLGIRVDPISVGGNVSGSATVCSETNNTQLTLSGHTGSVIKWQSSINNWVNYSDIANIATTLTVTNLSITTKYRAVVQSGVCSSVNSADASVIVNPLPDAVAGTDRAICLGSSSQIGATAVSGNTYSWTSSPAGFTSTAADPTVSPTATTIYTVVETITATGCTNSHSVTVTVNPLSDAVAGTDRAICLGSSSQIGATAVSGNTYSWTSSPAGFTSTAANPTVSPTLTTIYTLVETITATGCTNSHSVTVTVNPLPDAVAGTDRAICLGSSSQIGAAAVSGNTYSWTSLPAGFTSTAANPTVSPTATTIYTVVETITATGCTNSHSVTVTVNPLPSIDGIFSLCVGSTTQLTGSGTPASIDPWVSATTTVATVNSTGLVSGLAQGTSVITYTSNNGCFTTATVTVAPTSLTWDGSEGTAWENADNWTPAFVPIQGTYVSIPGTGITSWPVISTTGAVCTNLIIEPKGELTIKSDAALTTTTTIINSSSLTENGSLIVLGTINGTVTYNRQMRTQADDGDYHYFSSPVSGQSISGFKTSNVFDTSKSKVTGIWEWNESTGLWPDIYSSSGNFVSGQGYNLSQNIDLLNNCNFSFTGTSVNSAGPIEATAPYSTTIGNDAYKLTRGSWAGGGCNLLGNPFTSAMKGSDFINNPSNSNSLDPNYKALYIYDGKNNIYNFVGTEDVNFPNANGSDLLYVQVGQGFFVLSSSSNVNFYFTKEMQVSSTNTALKSVSVSNPWPGIQLKVKYQNTENSTIVVYNDLMTNGLDPGYYIGQLSANPDVEIYTALVKNDGVNFTRQALPLAGYDKNIVSVGTDSEKGGNVTFFAFMVPIGNGTFYLEDRTSGTFTDLSKDSYTVNLPAKTAGTGRFFIHASLTTGSKVLPANPNLLSLRMWAVNNKLNIEGAVSAKAIGGVYDVQGRKILEFWLNDSNLNTVDLPAVVRGVYLVKVTDGNKICTQKVVF